MELIKVVFFIIGTYFGVENSRVLAEKTTVMINPEEKTIIILHENVVSLFKNTEDSLKARTELKAITQPQHQWSSEFNDYSKKEKCFFISDDSRALNSKISLTYVSETDLKAFGIDLNPEGQLSMVNVPESHIKSTDGKLGERYWNFERNRPFTFTIEPFTNIPDKYKSQKKSLLPIWQTNKH